MKSFFRAKFFFLALVLGATVAAPSLYAKDKRGKAKETHKSSHSNKGCEICKELDKIECKQKKCCHEIKEDLSEIEDFLENQFQCDAVRAISKVPVTISHPGKYCVTKDLVYNGSLAAITVNADNVSINFQNHDLLLTNSAAVGILAQNVRELVIENDSISGASLFKTATSAAIQLVNVTKATLKNLFTQNTTRGIFVENSSDVFVKDSHLKFHEGTAPFDTNGGAGVMISNSTGVAVDNCVFEGANVPFTGPERNFGLQAKHTSQNVRVTNCSFTGWYSSLHFDSCTGVLVDNCQAIASDFSQFNSAQFGNVQQPTDQANDVILRNSTFTQHTLPGFDGLLFINGNGCLLENVVIDIQSITEPVSGYVPGAIHIGCAGNGGCDPALSYTNLLARNVIVRNQNDVGLYVENGFKCTFEECQFTDARLENIRFEGANNCIVKDSSITNAVGNVNIAGSGKGIWIKAGSNNNAIINCEVSTNAGTGILVDNGALMNHLRGNSVFDNGGRGIDDNDATTETYFNTSCNNSGTNCFGVSPAQTPGAPAVAGSNVCCTP